MTAMVTLTGEIRLIRVFDVIFLAPFRLAGRFFAYTFSSRSFEMRSLHAWGLVGAAVGCFIVLPFFRNIRPGGLLLWGAPQMMFVSALLPTGGRQSFGAARWRDGGRFSLSHYPAPDISVNALAWLIFGGFDTLSTRGRLERP